MTVIDHLVRSLKQASDHNRNDVAAPRVILWTDGERLWEPVMDLVRGAYEHVWTLGDYSAKQRTGPTAFLRAQVPARSPTTGTVPVVYLPGISRAAFRTATECPEIARHLYALQFEGQFWLQKNGKDWTPSAFLASADGGLGLDVARDADTIVALRECLAKVLEADVNVLGPQRLDAAEFRGLVADDPERMLLRWMGQPDLWREQWSKSEWPSFRAICRDKYGFDPERDGVIVAAEKLAARRGAWQLLWKRYADAPKAYPDVDIALDRVRPSDLFVEEEGYPAVNDRREESLREAFEAIAKLSHSDACARVIELARNEEPRADWVWAKLDRAHLAQAIVYLRTLVEAQKGFSGAHDWTGLASGYAQKGWEVDVAALHALAVAKRPADLHAIGTVLRGVYLPWLEKLSHATQAIAATYPNRDTSTARTVKIEGGTVIVFVDGLRFDLGRLLAEQLRCRGLNVGLSQEWAALPTVTATAKPAWLPLAASIRDGGQSAEFAPTDKATGKTITAPRFRELLAELNLTFLAPDDVGDPSRAAWTEAGAFDRHGHDEGRKLASRIEEQLEDVVERIQQLIDAGWKRVRVITDHGWLLLPGGLPKHDLPKHLTASRWGRCASPEAGAKHRFPETPWFWDPSQAIVLAPGVGCFQNGLEYSHGGLTLQEALLPALEVAAARSGTVGRSKPEITAILWKGLRLSVLIRHAEGMTIDLRRKAADRASSVLSLGQRNKVVPSSGEITLLIDDDSLIGSAALLVLATETGEVMFKHALNIGEN